MNPWKSALLLLAFQWSAIQGSLICPSGKYLFDGVCEPCPDNCSMCHSASICSECKVGFYGESCSNVCNANCRDNTCDKLKGVCISCSDGYFKDNNKNCIACPSNCLLCNSGNLCTMCKVGFKGRRCQEVCINCKPGMACDIWIGTCYECKHGLTGTACNKRCDSKCSVCQRMQGDKCVTCSDEKYGKTCENTCSLHCVNKTCNDADGFCTYGCQRGYWGALCEDRCITECSSGICDRKNGSCPQDYPSGGMGTPGNCPHGCPCDAQGPCLDLNTVTTINEDKRQVPSYIAAPLVSVLLLSVMVPLIYTKRKQLKFCTSNRSLSNRNGFAVEKVGHLTRRKLKFRHQSDITELESHDETCNEETSSEAICVVCQTVDNDSGRKTTQRSAGISSSSRIKRFLTSLEQRLSMRWRRQPIRVEEDTL